MWKIGEKTWQGLEKTKALGPAMKKLGKRWAHAARMGTRLSPHVGTALTVWDFGYSVGGKLIAPKVVAAIERRFENKWKDQEEELRRDIAHSRRLGEQRREGQETVSNMLAVRLATKKLRQGKRGPWATTDDRWGEDGKETNAADRGAEDPWAKDDPWAPESPDLRSTRSGAAQPAYRPSVSGEPGTTASDYRKALRKLEADYRSEQARGNHRAAEDPWAKEYPPASDTLGIGSAPHIAGRAAPVAAKDTQIGPSDDKKTLNAPQGSGTQSAGYERALEELDADSRAEQVRREAGAEAARHHRIAHAGGPETKQQEPATERAARELPSPDDCVKYERVKGRTIGRDIDAEYLIMTNKCPEPVIIYSTAIQGTVPGERKIYKYPSHPDKPAKSAIWQPGKWRDTWAAATMAKYNPVKFPKWWACAEYYPAALHESAGYASCKDSKKPRYYWQCPHHETGWIWTFSQCR